ncbi:19427_t:CDS:2 [Cetraspora pellucida]|uniref:19427_t:CDS:1 n=1 Tax=Cetraspora pellucida TaxID=1433469 RepID=A0A9N9AX64_9GLOM|nr:19427_t:CDS:2 [Cetraspora pellucida]
MVTNHVEQGSSSSNFSSSSWLSHLNNLRNLVEDTNYDIIRKKKEKLEYYKQKFGVVLVLYEQEIDNYNFINNFNTLVALFVNEINKCKEILRARHQQNTWTLNEKLAFWLCDRFLSDRAGKHIFRASKGNTSKLANIVHLDLKPENILILKDKYKIGDFGLALELSTDTEDPGLHIGNRKYIALKVLEDNIFSKSADIFSFGTIILQSIGDRDLPTRGKHWLESHYGNLTQFSSKDSQDLIILVKNLIQKKI